MTMPRKCIEVRRKGKVEVTGTDTVVTLGLARDRKRIWSRPGAGWVDLEEVNLGTKRPASTNARCKRSEPDPLKQKR
jgi:hypothetical protein